MGTREYPAPGSAGEAPGSAFDHRLACRRDRGLDLDALAVADHVNRFQIGGRADQLLGQTEAEGEILQILGCGHHDDVGYLVVDQHHGRLFDEVLGPFGNLVGPPLPDRVFKQGRSVAWLFRGRRLGGHPQ